LGGFGRGGGTARGGRALRLTKTTLLCLRCGVLTPLFLRSNNTKNTLTEQAGGDIVPLSTYVAKFGGAPAPAAAVARAAPAVADE
jgi:hypothetical protein